MREEYRECGVSCQGVGCGHCYIGRGAKLEVDAKKCTIRFDRCWGNTLRLSTAYFISIPFSPPFNCRISHPSISVNLIPPLALSTGSVALTLVQSL